MVKFSLQTSILYTLLNDVVFRMRRRRPTYQVRRINQHWQVDE